MTASVNRDAAAPARIQASSLVTLTLGATALAACAFAFVGLSAEGYWTDELFTLFLINHHGGVAEVWRRALTDTHPPLYYFILYGWAQVFGQSETALRALSAFFCIGAVAVFVVGTRRSFSLNARLFAGAVAATSPFWFQQSQNIRNYTLCLLLSSILTVLAIRARAAVREDRPVPAPIVTGLCLFGAAEAFTHFYGFLTVGLVYLFLILTVASPRLRAALLVSGAAIFAADVAYMRLLLHHTQLDPHDTWFRTDAVFFSKQALQALEGLIGPGALVSLIALGIATIGSRRGDAQRAAVSDTVWSVWLGLAVVAGVIAAGIAVSLLFAPSLSDQNVLIAGPLLWPAMAAAFEGAQARARRRWMLLAAAVPTLAMATQLITQAERWLPRGEAWRESARFVLNQPGCAGQTIPVLLPAKFGPPTPFFRHLAQRDFYGYYFAGQAARLAPFTAALTGPGPVSLEAGFKPGACPVMVWAVHDIDRTRAQALAGALARSAGLSPADVQTVTFETARPVWTYPKRAQSAFVFLRRPH